MNIGALFNAFDSLRKRDGDLETVVKTVFFHSLMDKYPKKTIREVLCNYKGGSWGNDFFQDSIPAKVLRSPDIRFGFIDFQNAEERYFTEKELENYRLKNNDILVIKSNGSLDLVGKSQIFKSNQNFKNIVASNFLMVITPNTEIIYPEYLDLFLKSPEALIWRFDTQKTTTGLRNLNTNAFLDIELPVPESIEEQILLFENFSNYLNGSFNEEDRTIAKFYKVVKLKEKISEELSYQLTQLENLNQAILQEAVQGKLVPQDKNDEPASELLKRIKAEKAKSGKKEKPLPTVKPEEIPFEIPENWVWCRLGEITDIQRGSSPRPKGDPRYFSKSKTNFNWITISDISNFCENNVLLQTREFLTAEGSKHSRYVDVNEFIIAVSGSTTGKCCITGVEGFIYDGLAVAKIIENSFDSRYILNYMMCLYTTINNSKTGASFPNINTDYLNNLIFPLPPIKEQIRINKEIEKQFAKTKQIKEYIIANQQATEQLLKALLHQAFEVREI